MPDVFGLRLWISILVLLTGLGEGLCAQPTSDDEAYDLEDDYLVRTWTTSNGLPANYIDGLYQTSDGYLWLGTGGGLVRFDGAHFRVFTPEELGWSRAFTRALHEDTTGTLWALSQNDELAWIKGGRVVRPPPETIPRPPNPFSRDESGRLWLHAADEHFRVRGDTAYAFTAQWLPERKALRLAFDLQGRLWAAAGDSVYALQPSQSADLECLERSGRAPEAIYAEAEGAWWLHYSECVARIQGGALTTFDEKDVFLTRIHGRYLDQRERLWIWGEGGTAVWEDGAFTPFARDRLPYPSVRRVYETSDGALFLVAGGADSAERNHLFQYEAGRFVPLSLQEHLRHRTIEAVMKDAEGNLWIGTDGGLVCLTPRRVQALTERNGLPEGLPMPLLQTSDGAIWIGTWGGGVARLEDGRLRVFQAVEPEANLVRVLYEDQDGQLWIGTAAGLARLRNGQIEVVAPQVRRMSSLLQDREGRLWVGGAEGLFVVEPRMGIKPDVRQIQPGLREIQALHEDRRGRLWVGSRYGLSRRDGEHWQRFSQEDGVGSGHVVAFHEEEDGTLWLGTFGSGLLRYQNGRFFRYGLAHGLPDLNAIGLLEDDRGDLWINSYAGIYRVAKTALNDVAAGRRDRLQPLVLTEADGLPSREGNRASPAALKANDGRLWFPTLHGVAHFDPAEIEPRPPPKVHIEEVAADGVPMPLGEGDRSTAFDVRARNLAFGYTGVHLAAPEELRFRYWLDGVDTDWVEAGTEQSARYASLAPGAYTFLVAAATPHGAWSEAASFSFQIEPFFYETAWFYLLCGLFVVLAVAGAFRLREHHHRRHTLEALVRERTSKLEQEKQKTEAQAEQLREMDQAKSRFFANLSHEFKTPLTMILGPVQDLLSGKQGMVDRAARRQLEVARRYARRLTRLTDQLLDLAKLEAEEMAIRKAPGDLVGFVREAVQSYVPLAERNGIALTFQAHAESLACLFDADQLATILGNLLSNALKFTPEDGKVLVTVASDKVTLHVRVRDTGPGIPADKLPHVFNRFYQADDSSTRAHEGTGIGLSLAKELTELHGGTIEVASEEGFGAEFIMTLPWERPHPTEQTARPALEPGSEPVSSNGRPAFAELGSGGMADRAANDLAEVGANPDADAPTVLIAEDNMDVRVYLRSHLAPMYHLLEAMDGREALEQARARKPDLVVSDVMMPEMDGLALCQALKTDDDLSDIPVLLLTAKGGTENRVEGLGVGADAYLEKPFEMDELQARIQSLIKRHRRLRERYGREIHIRPTDVRIQPADEVFLNEAHTVAEAHLHRRDFTADAFADAMNLTKGTLNRKLKAVAGLSPGAFLKHLRLERAAQLLHQDAGLTVYEVARAVGYKDADHFAKVFREQFGVLPSQYRANGA